MMSVVISYDTIADLTIPSSNFELQLNETLSRFRKLVFPEKEQQKQLLLSLRRMLP